MGRSDYQAKMKMATMIHGGGTSVERRWRAGEELTAPNMRADTTFRSSLSTEYIEQDSVICKIPE